MTEGNNTVITDYIRDQEPSIQTVLHEIRNLIKEIVPEAEEKFSYGMPTFYYFGNLVHFAVFKNHIGFYPAPSGIANFEEELRLYKTSKGAVQFPIGEPVPYDLIRGIVSFRKQENEEIALRKKMKKKNS